MTDQPLPEDLEISTTYHLVPKIPKSFEPLKDAKARMTVGNENDKPLAFSDHSDHSKWIAFLHPEDLMCLCRLANELLNLEQEESESEVFSRLMEIYNASDEWFFTLDPETDMSQLKNLLSQLVSAFPEAIENIRHYKKLPKAEDLVTNSSELLMYRLSKHPVKQLIGKTMTLRKYKHVDLGEKIEDIGVLEAAIELGHYVIHNMISPTESHKIMYEGIISPYLSNVYSIDLLAIEQLTKTFYVTHDYKGVWESHKTSTKTIAKLHKVDLNLVMHSMEEVDSKEIKINMRKLKSFLLSNITMIVIIGVLMFVTPSMGFCFDRTIPWTIPPFDGDYRYSVSQQTIDYNGRGNFDCYAEKRTIKSLVDHDCDMNCNKNDSNCKVKAFSDVFNADNSFKDDFYPDGDCFCVPMEIIDQTFAVNDLGARFKLLQMNKTRECYGDQRQSRGKKDKGEVLGCVAYAQVLGKEIVIAGQTECLVAATLTVGSFSQTYDMTKTNKIRIPEFLLTGVSAEITIIFKDGSSKTSNIILPRNSDLSCGNLDCFMCIENVENYGCNTLAHNVTLAMMILILLLLILLFIWFFGKFLRRLIIWSFWALTCCVLCKKVIFYSRASQLLGRKLREKKDAIVGLLSINKQNDEEKGESEKFINDNEELDSDRIESEVVGSKPTVGSVKRPKFTRSADGKIVIACVLIFAVGFSQCCDQTALLIQTTTETCTYEGTKATCNVMFEIDTTLFYKGTEVCFHLVSTSPGVENKTLALGSIKYLNLESSIALATQYYTSAWDGHGESRQRCYDAGPCSGGCSSCCSSKDAQGQLSDWRVLYFPGISYCRRGCGCVSCGCFFCDDACIYSGFGLVPKGDIYAVYLSSRRTWIPIVNITLTDSEKPQHWILRQDGSSFNNGIFNGVVNLKSQPPQAAFPPDGRGFVVNTKTHHAYVAQVSKANAPQAGIIGDIQGESVSKMSNPFHPDSFIFARDIHSIRQQDESDTYTFAQSALTESRLLQNMPAVLAGDLWTYNQRDVSIKSNLTNAGSLLFRLSTTKPFQLIRTISVVCPTGELVKAEGCYSCEAGGFAILKLKSTCSKGFVTTSASDPDVKINTPGLSINEDLTEYTVRYSSPDRYVDFYLSIKGTVNVATFHIKYTANSGVVIITPNDTTVTTGDKGGSSSGWDDFWSGIDDFFIGIFDGTDSWWEYIIFIIIIAIGLVIVALLCYCLWPFFLTMIEASRTIGYMIKNRVSRKNKVN